MHGIPIGPCTVLHKTGVIRHSSRLVVLSDGVYMGRQGSTQIGQSNLRIGYRHPGPQGNTTITNVGFADGHCEAIDGFSFPQSKSTSNPNAAHENLTGPTVYDNPEGIFGGVMISCRHKVVSSPGSSLRLQLPNHPTCRP
jgi:prepilin-type processing-associated H-X9-DG protein